MDFFNLSHHKTDVKTEIGAGITTFLTMVYIIPVNANLMSKTGMPIEALIAATAIVTIIATLVTGFFANVPVAMSVGMGLNAYFVFSVCLTKHVAWQSALGAVFFSGLIFLLLSFTNFRVWIINSIPQDLRRAISAGVGLFIAFIGLQQIGIIAKNDAVIVGIGNFSDKNVLFGLFGIILAISFWAWKLKGAFILSIIVSSLVGWGFHIHGASFPEHIFSLPNFSSKDGLGSIMFALDFKSVFQIAMIPIVLTFFVTQLFDSIGTITGVGVRGKIFEDKDGSNEGTKRLSRTLGADAFGSTIGALFGTSTVTAFVESSTGVEAGGRTGLTAVVTALCFVVTLFLLPIFKAIPANSVYPILVIVGILMFMEVSNINFKDEAIAVATFFTVIMMPLTYSITTGFSFGFISYVMVRILKREFDKISFGMIFISLISLIVFMLQGYK